MIAYSVCLRVVFNNLGGALSGKLTGNDIRSMGSGNAGLTNTLRTQGKASSAIVLLGDVAKAQQIRYDKHY